MSVTTRGKRTPSARLARLAKLRETVKTMEGGSSSSSSLTSSASAVKSAPSSRKKRKATSASARKALAGDSRRSASVLSSIDGGRKKRRRPLAALKEHAASSSPLAPSSSSSSSSSSAPVSDPPVGLRPTPSDSIASQLAKANATNADSSQAKADTTAIVGSPHIKSHLELARQENDIRRENASLQLHSELSNAESKAERLALQLRNAVEENREASSHLSALELEHSRDKSKMAEEIRKLKHKLRSAEIAQHESLGESHAKIRDLELKLLEKANAEDRAADLEKNAEALEKALEREKERALRDQKKLSETLDMLSKIRTTGNESAGQSSKSGAALAESEAMAASRHLARIAELERVVRTQRREGTLLKKRVETQMLLEERISELETQLQHSREANARADRMQSERDQLIAERQSWNDSFADIVKSLRASAGVSTESSFSDECTAATANKLLRELQQRQAVALQQTGSLQARVVELEAAVESARRAERESGRKAHESLERNARLEEEAVSANSRIRFLESEKQSFQRMIKSYQQELEMDDSVRDGALTTVASPEAIRKASEHVDKAASEAEAAARAETEADDDDDKVGEKRAAAKAASDAEKNALKELSSTRASRIQELERQLTKSMSTIAALKERAGKAGERETIAVDRAEKARKRAEDLERLRHGSPSVSIKADDFKCSTPIDLASSVLPFSVLFLAPIIIPFLFSFHSINICTTFSSLLPFFLSHPNSIHDTALAQIGSLTATKNRNAQLERKLDERDAENLALLKQLRSAESQVVDLSHRLARGEFDPKKTKVLHLSANPAAAARVQHKKDKAELREQVFQMLERAGVLDSKDHPIFASRLVEDWSMSVLQAVDAVAAVVATQKSATLSSSSSSEDSGSGTSTNSAVASGGSGAVISSNGALNAGKVKALEKKVKAQVEAFKRIRTKYQSLVYALTGWKVAYSRAGGVIEVGSLYAEDESHKLRFKDSGDGRIQLLKTSYSEKLEKEGSDALMVFTQFRSFPGLLAQLTLELLEKTTIL